MLHAALQRAVAQALLGARATLLLHHSARPTKCMTKSTLTHRLLLSRAQYSNALHSPPSSSRSAPPREIRSRHASLLPPATQVKLTPLVLPRATAVVQVCRKALSAAKGTHQRMVVAALPPLLLLVAGAEGAAVVDAEPLPEAVWGVASNFWMPS